MLGLACHQHGGHGFGAGQASRDAAHRALHHLDQRRAAAASTVHVGARPQGIKMAAAPAAPALSEAWCAPEIAETLVHRRRAIDHIEAPFRSGADVLVEAPRTDWPGSCVIQRLQGKLRADLLLCAATSFQVVATISPLQGVMFQRRRNPAHQRKRCPACRVVADKIDRAVVIQCAPPVPSHHFFAIHFPPARAARCPPCPALTTWDCRLTQMRFCRRFRRAALTCGRRHLIRASPLPAFPDAGCIQN